MIEVRDASDLRLKRLSLPTINYDKAIARGCLTSSTMLNMLPAWVCLLELSTKQSDK